MKKTIGTALFFVISMTLFSCQKSTTEDLQDVQICLNTAPAAQARGCVEKIASDTSEVAYKLRCAAIFIAEGFGTTSSFIAAVESLKAPGTCGTGCSSTVTAVSAMRFSSGNNTTLAGQNQNDASSLEAFDNCNKSGTPIYGQLGSLFRLGTLAYVFTTVANPTQDQIESAIAALPPAKIGDLVIATHQSACQNLESAPESTVAYCTELGAALAKGGTTLQIGVCFQTKATNPSHVCPTY